ncbi:histidine kinase dimerization/phospho-acceptor domain-containing protein [candidate division KSB1 bacterium]
MKKEKEQIETLKLENQKLKSELDETYRAILELTNELEKKSEKLIRANRQIKAQQKQLLGEEKLKAVLEMARAIAHEIAQPLSVMSGRCELLSRIDNLAPEATKHVNSILLNVKKMIDIIHKIQSISKYITKPYIQNYNMIDIYN